MDNNQRISLRTFDVNEPYDSSVIKGRSIKDQIVQVMSTVGDPCKIEYRYNEDGTTSNVSGKNPPYQNMYAEILFGSVRESILDSM